MTTMRYWWMSFAVSKDDGWRFTEAVSKGYDLAAHPFEELRQWGDPKTYGRPVLISWREITEAEYRLHGEHVP